jgi:hypothetical protein
MTSLEELVTMFAFFLLEETAVCVDQAVAWIFIMGSKVC